MLQSKGWYRFVNFSEMGLLGAVGVGVLAGAGAIGTVPLVVGTVGFTSAGKNSF